jgi:hypothetical protein
MCSQCNTMVPIGHYVKGTRPEYAQMWCIPCHKLECPDPSWQPEDPSKPSKPCELHEYVHFMDMYDASSALDCIRKFHPSGMPLFAAPSAMCLLSLVPLKPNSWPLHKYIHWGMG